MTYSVTPLTPTDDLLTLGRYFLEVGGYASTVMTSDNLSFARQCESRLMVVAEELMKRKAIQSIDDLCAVSGSDTAVPRRLENLSVDALERLYRQAPARRKKRQEQGRETFSYYTEGRIVSELQRRIPANDGERLKIRYCLDTYRNELENMSFVFSCPVMVDDDKIFPDIEKEYTAEELTALIRLYSDFRDVTEREILVEYADLALDLLSADSATSTSHTPLLSALAELSLRKTIRIPAWVNEKLESATTDCEPRARQRRHPTNRES